jgi:agmatine deiminase
VAKSEGTGQFRAVPEWLPCRALWVAWPHDAEFWGPHFATAKRQLAALCAVVDRDPSTRLEVVVSDPRSARDFEDSCGRISPPLRTVAYDDIWLRDIGPVFGRGPSGLAGACFSFNGWGGKWPHERDRGVGRRIAELAGAAVVEVPLVLEGGAVEFNGEGTCITTEAVVLNANRNPRVSASDVARAFERAFGVERVIWLKRGLRGDHTDGHVDNLARFVAPGRVVCTTATQPDDPNAAVYEEVAHSLRTATDERGRSLEVVEVPSPGAIVDAGGDLLPASYLNYCLTDEAVVVPVFGSPYDQAGVDAIGACFPGREAVGLEATGLLNGGGGFHCATLNEPRAEAIASGT